MIPNLETCIFCQRAMSGFGDNVPLFEVNVGDLYIQSTSSVRY